MLAPNQTRNYLKASQNIVQPKDSKTQDSEMLADVPEEELDEFAPNEVKLLKQLS